MAVAVSGKGETGVSVCLVLLRDRDEVGGAGGSGAWAGNEPVRTMHGVDIRVWSRRHGSFRRGHTREGIRLYSLKRM